MRVDVHAVADELERHGVVLEQGEHGARVAVVQRTHRVEQVGGVAGTGGDGGARRRAVGVGVADRGDGAEPDDAAYGIDAARELGREGHHAHGVVADEVVDLGGVRGPQMRRVVRAAVRRRQPRTLEVDPDQQPVLDQRGEGRDLAPQPVARAGHQARHQRRGAVREVQGRGRARGVGIGTERGASAAVAVQVDEAGDEHHVAEVVHLPHRGVAAARPRPTPRCGRRRGRPSPGAGRRAVRRRRQRAGGS